MRQLEMQKEIQDKYRQVVAMSQIEKDRLTWASVRRYVANSTSLMNRWESCKLIAVQNGLSPWWALAQLYAIEPLNTNTAA